MTERRRPHYLATDSLHLPYRLEGMVYVQLSDKQLLSRLGAWLANCRGYEKYLPGYPAVVCAPLDVHYVFRRASCSLDEALLEDLLFSFSWREATWGAWLAALAPQARYVEALRRRSASLPEATVVTELAILSCDGGPVPPALSEPWTLLCELRSQLEQLPRLRSPLRVVWTLQQDEALKLETEAVRAAYRQGGAAACLQAIARQPLWGLYSRDHLSWAREQSLTADPGPTRLSSIP